MAEALGGVKSIVLPRKTMQIDGMKNYLLPLVFVSLTGCTPFSIYYQEGATVSRMQTDTINCEVSALAKVPVNSQTRREAPRYIPGPRICDGLGNCSYGAGYYVPGRVYTVDTNLRLREQVETQCMTEKGYSEVQLPTCSQSVANSVPEGSTNRLPPLTPTSCVIRNEDKTWQIVSQVR